MDYPGKIALLCLALAFFVAIVWINAEARAIERDGAWHLHDTWLGFGEPVMKRRGRNGWETRPPTDEELRRSMEPRDKTW